MNGSRFSQSQIASALGVTKQAVANRLRGIVPSGNIAVRGQIAPAWNLEQLPRDFQETLTERSTVKGYRSEAHLLSSPPQKWRPMINGEEVKLSELHPECLERATRLQQSLLPLIARLADLPTAALEAEGVALYGREFGCSITGRHWRKLAMRVIERDNGLQEWHRIELYLPERLYRRPEPSDLRLPPSAGLSILEKAIAQATLPEPTRQQLELVWLGACDELQAQLDEGAIEKPTKLKILQALNRFGFLAKSADGLRKAFSRKWEAYRMSNGNPSALRDGRSQPRKTLEISQGDRKKLLAHALDCGGRVAQAWRELHREGELSAELSQRFIINPASKSHVPHAVWRAIAPDVRRLLPLHHGPRRHELEGPSVPRDYSQMFAGQVGQMDDVTCPVYYWEEDLTSPSGYWFGRGQLILAVDVRSMLALSFALHSANVYNMRLVRGLMLRWHDDWGLPETLYLERGMWKSAKILKGDEADLSHTEMGLREFGIKFTHAKLPRGKLIENIIGKVQNQMERLPGYAGRDEIRAGFEKITDQIEDVNAGRVHPSKYFFHKEQWVAELTRILGNYNAEPQEGDVLKGLSPLEAWNRFQSPAGIIHLGAQARYLLAHHKLKMRVPKNGIRLRSSLGGGLYCNEITGRFVGQEMLVWVNPDEPAQITITSLDKKQGPFVIPRLDAIPAIGASGDQIGGARQQIAGHLDYARTLYRTIAPGLAVHRYRKTLVDRPTVELGQKIAAEQEVAQIKRRDTRRAIRKVSNLSRELKVAPRGVTATNAERVATGLDLIAEAKREHAKTKGVSK